MSNEAVAIASQDYKVADISLAGWGRKEIAIAETEMPGLMASIPATSTNMPMPVASPAFCLIRDASCESRLPSDI